MLQTLINSLNRDQLLAAMNDPSVSDDTLRAALLHCLNGATAPAAAPAVAPAAAVPSPAAIRAAIAASVPAAPAAAKPAAPLKPAAASTNAADAIVGALLAAGTGFAVADVITAGAEFGVTRSQAGSAIKRAVKVGACSGAGSRRFTRYGASAAIAQAASTAARG